MGLFHKITGIATPEQRQRSRDWNFNQKLAKEHNSNVKHILNIIQIDGFNKTIIEAQRINIFSKEEFKDIWSKNPKIKQNPYGTDALLGEKDNDGNFLPTLNYYEYFSEQNQSDIDKQIELEKSTKEY